MSIAKKTKYGELICNDIERNIRKKYEPDSFYMRTFFCFIIMSLCILTQIIVNIGVCTSLLPNTGLPLPLVSYGGSSVLVNFAELAICVTVSKKSVIKASKKIAKEELK